MNEQSTQLGYRRSETGKSEMIQMILSSIVQPHVVSSLSLVCFFFFFFACQLKSPVPFFKFTFCLLVNLCKAENYLQTQPYLQFKCSSFSGYNLVLQYKYSNEIKHSTQFNLQMDPIFFRSQRGGRSSVSHGTNMAFQDHHLRRNRQLYGCNLEGGILLDPNSVC